MSVCSVVLNDGVRSVGERNVCEAVEEELRESEAKYSGKNLYRCDFVHHMSHTRTDLGSNPGCRYESGVI
jgi:hypothetical protein